MPARMVRRETFMRISRGRILSGDSDGPLRTKCVRRQPVQSLLIVAIFSVRFRLRPLDNGKLRPKRPDGVVRRPAGDLDPKYGEVEGDWLLAQAWRRTSAGRML